MADKFAGGLQEVQYAVGRFCCARLQMYHALMHYKHRLRGKLKKRIKAEYKLQRVKSKSCSLHPSDVLVHVIHACLCYPH